MKSLLIASLAGWLVLLPGAWLSGAERVAEARPKASTISTNDPSFTLYRPDQLLEVSISIASADWEKLRREHHDLLAVLGPTRFDKPEPKPYKTYRADVTINGVVVKGVGLRKRGFIGSSSFARPSLGLRFDEFEPEQKFRGLKRMALNNNLQDPSQLHQVLAYRIFAKAGVPAPRCNLARVTVNGQSLGIYSNVEPIEKPFLKAHFGDSSGNLYEGQVSDFRPEWVKTFQKKTDKANVERSDLEAVVKALQSDNDSLLGALEPLVDIDAYLSYWAVESLLGHWDSYSWNGNNFLVYRGPADRKFHFIPWGADATFGDHDPFSPYQAPESVKARSILPYRLYQLPTIQERYRERLRQILATVWTEQELLIEVDQLEGLLKGQVSVTQARFQEGLDQVRHFLKTRRAVLNSELTNKAPEWKIPLRDSACLRKGGTLNVSFETTWEKVRPRDALRHGIANLSMQWEGARQEFSATGVVAVPAEDNRNAGCPTLSLVGWKAGSLKLMAFVIQPEYFKPGPPVPIDGFGVGGALLEGLPGLNFRLTGFPVGTLRLLNASTNLGDKVVGKIQADLYTMPH